MRCAVSCSARRWSNARLGRPDAGRQVSKIYVVRLGEELCARHLHMDDGHVRLKASNSKYEDIKVSDLDLVGQVVWHMRKM